MTRANRKPSTPRARPPGATTVFEPPAPDPVYKAIREHWSAWLAVDAASATIKQSKADERRFERLCRAFWAEEDRLAVIKPVSFAGLCALVRYMNEISEEVDHPGTDPHRLIEHYKTLAVTTRQLAGLMADDPESFNAPKPESHSQLMEEVEEYVKVENRRLRDRARYEQKIEERAS